MDKRYTTDNKGNSDILIVIEVAGDPLKILKEKLYITMLDFLRINF